MKRYFVLFIILFIATCAYAAEQKLSSAYEQELIQRVKGVFGSTNLWDESGEPSHPISATPIFLEAFANYDKLSSGARKILSPLLRQRPDSLWADPRTFDTPSGHIKIHYVISGTDSVFESSVDTLPADGHPDYVNRCAEIMDSVWQHEINTLGYDQPPSDSWYPPNNGGDGKYDAYLVSMDPGYLGFTIPEYFSGYPGACSYIVLRSDYSIFTKPPYNLYVDQYDAIEVTAAHEFFHGIQMGYDAEEFEGGGMDYRPYWMEISAVWMEDMVYDEVNDYLGYLYYFFRYPWLSLKTFSHNSGDKPKYYHAYASCVWAIYLSEKFGQDIIKDIWTKCGQVPGDNALLATSQALAERGSSLDQAFQEFTIWNYFTSTRADTLTFYSEGNLFPNVYNYDTQNHSSYPVNVSSAVSPPENLGSNYVIFHVPYGATGGLNANFYGDSLTSWEVSLIGYQLGNPPWFSQINLDSLENGTKDVYNWNQYSKIIMIPAVTDQYDDDAFEYAYVAAIDTALDVDEEKEKNIVSLIKLLQNYPNPFNLTTTIPFTVHGKLNTENRPLLTTLRIYNILGQEIKILVDEEKLPGTYEISWNGKDNNGIEVASGIYFYKLQAGQHTQIKKMLLVK